MNLGVQTVGTSAVRVTPTDRPSLGMRLLARSANSGTVYVGLTSAVTTATGNRVPKGDLETSTPFVIPSEHFASGGQVWLIADASAQLVDWTSE